VVNNDATSHRTNPLAPVFSPFLAYVPVSGIATFVQVICQVKTARLPDFYCFLGVSIHDCRDSQPSSGWLRKVGVLDFSLLLTQVLADYPGTLLLVSHDSDFVAGVGVEREYRLEGRDSII
jgi:hypothetical protein